MLPAEDTGRCETAITLATVNSDCVWDAATLLAREAGLRRNGKSKLVTGDTDLRWNAAATLEAGDTDSR